jgi:hypothetical protein
MGAIQQVLFGSGGGVRFLGIDRLNGLVISSQDTAPNGATASFGLNQGNITVIEGIGSNFATIGQWVSPNSAAVNYQVRAIKTLGGADITGTLNTWVDLGGNIQWFLNIDPRVTIISDFTPAYGTNTGTAELLIEIRTKSALPVIVSSATITLTATAFGNE